MTILLSLEKMTNKVKLVVFNKMYLDKSWIWLNDPEIRYLTNSGSFSKEEQLNWFNNLQNLSNYLIWGIEVDCVPVGAIGIKNINGDVAEYWGYIGEKDYWGKGIGRTALLLLFDEARRMGINKLYLKVIRRNIRAINLYRKLNFSISSELKEFFIMERQI